MEVVKKCPCCGSLDLSSFIKTTDKHYGVIGEFTTSQCNDCRLVFMNPMPDNNELSEFYPKESYYSFKMDIEKENNTLKEKILELLCVNFPLHEPKFNSSGVLLDVGCGNGYRLLPYKNKGWSVHGVEPDVNAAQIGNLNGLNIHCGTLNTAGYEENQFDYIFSNHSFEHINNPNEFLEECYRVLKDNGKLFIGVPNIDGTIAKLAKECWFYFGLPVHTFNYSSSTLRQILEKHKFKVENLYYNSSWVGILGTLQIVFNKYILKKSSSDGFLLKFKPLKIMMGFLAKLLNSLQKGDCIEIIVSKK